LTNTSVGRAIATLSLVEGSDPANAGLGRNKKVDLKFQVFLKFIGPLFNCSKNCVLYLLIGYSCMVLSCNYLQKTRQFEKMAVN
jgi:hypothetical protein